MGKLSGAVLVVAGVVIATYALSAGQQTGAESAAAAARAKFKASAAPGTGDPPEGQAKVAGAAADEPHPAPSAPPPVAKSAEPKPNPQPLTGKVIPPPGPLSIAEAPPRVPVDHSKTATTAPRDKDGLTREIQRQLRRVGCYGGAITGVWSPAVRRAMKAFTDRANATLPVEQPDQILLALVQSHKQAICGAACPRGQAAGGDGRCLPNALVARAKKPNAWAKAGPPTTARGPGEAGGPTTGPAAAPPPPTPPNGPPPTGRMSLAGPPPAADPPGRIKTATSHRKNVRRYAPAARPSRYADTRRERRRAARVSPGPYSGMPWWAVPVFSP
jgi:hypothetical protein